jgi:hypothetical protein
MYRTREYRSGEIVAIREARKRPCKLVKHLGQDTTEYQKGTVVESTRTTMSVMLKSTNPPCQIQLGKKFKAYFESGILFDVVFHSHNASHPTCIISKENTAECSKGAHQIRFDRDRRLDAGRVRRSCNYTSSHNDELMQVPVGGGGGVPSICLADRDCRRRGHQQLSRRGRGWPLAHGGIWGIYMLLSIASGSPCASVLLRADRHYLSTIE